MNTTWTHVVLDFYVFGLGLFFCFCAMPIWCRRCQVWNVTEQDMGKNTVQSSLPLFQQHCIQAKMHKSHARIYIGYISVMLASFPDSSLCLSWQRVMKRGKLENKTDDCLSLSGLLWWSLSHFGTRKKAKTGDILATMETLNLWQIVLEVCQQSIHPHDLNLLLLFMMDPSFHLCHLHCKLSACFYQSLQVERWCSSTHSTPTPFCLATSTVKANWELDSSNKNNP